MMSKSIIDCGSIALRTVPVYLKSGNRKLKVNALLDDASTKTYGTEHEKTRLMYTKYISLYYGTYLLYCLRY